MCLQSPALKTHQVHDSKRQVATCAFTALWNNDASRVYETGLSKQNVGTKLIVTHFVVDCNDDFFTSRETSLFISANNELSHNSPVQCGSSTSKVVSHSHFHIPIFHQDTFYTKKSWKSDLQKVGKTFPFKLGWLVGVTAAELISSFLHQNKGTRLVATRCAQKIAIHWRATPC